MTGDRVAEIAARLEAATPGPWVAGMTSVRGPREPDDLGRGPAKLAAMQMPYRMPRVGANAEFMAHARQDIPYLLAELEAANRALAAVDAADQHDRAENARLRAQLDAVREGWCPCVGNRPQDCKPEEWPLSVRHGLAVRLESANQRLADRAGDDHV